MDERFTDLAPLRHSRLGLLSFGIGLIAWLLFIWAVIEWTFFAGPQAYYEVFFLSGCGYLASLPGAVFGLIALFKPGRKKLYSAIGLALNGGLIPMAFVLAVIVPYLKK